jgi:GTP-binding protein
VSIETGAATAYALEGLQERSVLFVDPADKIYVGQVVGENARTDDLICNPTRKKNLTNHRSSTKDIGVKLDVPRRMTLEQAMEWIRSDELVEVTPTAVRIRKAILDVEERKKAEKKQAALDESAGASPRLSA